jgi:hypothetical protein
LIESVDPEDEMDTLAGLIEEENHKLVANGLDLLPHKCSQGWHHDLTKKLKIKTLAIKSREEGPPEEEECKEYEKDTNAMIAEKNIAPQYIIHHDEFSEIRTRPKKKVRTSFKERCMARLGRRSLGQVALTNNSKVKHTVGTFMSPGYGIVCGYVIFREVGQAELKRIQKAFGDFLLVIKHAPGGMDGSLHAFRIP